jgi:thiol:disulfide interchange protein DsbD
VFWGLFTLLMPCTYPMIPITISFFTKQAEQNPSKQLLLSVTYGLGIVAIFILIGVLFGSVIIPFATHPITNIVIGTLFVVFALALFGWIDLRPPAFLLSAAGKASMRGGLVGVFLMGATLVVTSFTCTAPFVGSLLAAGASGGMVRTVLGMGVFGLTMAVPFVLLSMVPRRLAAMPRAGEWMHVLKVFMGFVELAAALKFLSNADLVWQWGFLTRELFLVLWAAIFAVAGLFLLGMIHLKGESHDGIGPGRLVAGTMTILMAAYCTYGLRHELDSVMTSIVPNYSKPLGVVGAGGSGGSGGHGDEAIVRRDHTIVRDDYDEARRLAAAEGKALLVNFTGHT